MVQLTDEDYSIIAQNVYTLDPKENEEEEQPVKGKVFKVNGRQFQVIDATGNSAEPTTNSMQLNLCFTIAVK